MPELLATQSASWWPFVIVTLAGTAWVLLCIGIAARLEKHDGPFSFAIIPVLLGIGIIVGVVEKVW